MPYGRYSFTKFTAPFPACNHTEGFDKEYNHGYVQGVTGDGVPFEAEHKPDEPIPYQRKEEFVENYLLQLNITIWSEDMGELVETYMDFKPFMDLEVTYAVFNSTE